jgi:hypothetical protein
MTIRAGAFTARASFFNAARRTVMNTRVATAVVAAVMMLLATGVSQAACTIKNGVISLGVGHVPEGKDANFGKLLSGGVQTEDISSCCQSQKPEQISARHADTAWYQCVSECQRFSQFAALDVYAEGGRIKLHAKRVDGVEFTQMTIRVFWCDSGG